MRILTKYGSTHAFIRRTKDYIRVVKVLEKAASNLGHVLDPDQLMFDFEIAANKAFEKTFPRCIVKDWAFDWSKSFQNICAIGLKYTLFL